MATEESEDIVGIVTIDIDLVEHGILSAILGASEVLNPGIVVRLLVQELVAWECKNFESVCMILGIELGHPSIMRGGQSSEAGDISDEGDLFAS